MKLSYIICESFFIPSLRVGASFYLVYFFKGFGFILKVKPLEMNSVKSSNLNILLSNANKLAFIKLRQC
jgi:hypothetical protein